MKKLIILGVLLFLLVGSAQSQVVTKHSDKTINRRFPSEDFKITGNIITSDSMACYFDSCFVHRLSRTVYTDWDAVGAKAKALKYWFCITAVDTFWQSTYEDSFTITLQTSATTDGSTPVYDVWSIVQGDTATTYKDFSNPDTTELYMILPYLRSRFDIIAWADSHRVHMDSSSHRTYWRILQRIQGLK